MRTREGRIATSASTPTTRCDRAVGALTARARVCWVVAWGCGVVGRRAGPGRGPTRALDPVTAPHYRSVRAAGSRGRWPLRTRSCPRDSGAAPNRWLRPASRCNRVSASALLADERSKSPRAACSRSRAARAVAGTVTCPCSVATGAIVPRRVSTERNTTAALASRSAARWERSLLSARPARSSALAAA